MHLPKVKNWKKLGFLLVLVSVCLAGRAQIYPVQVSTQLTPPYDVYLPDYASPGGEKLRIVLLQRDLTIQGYRLRFEMKIQVNGLTIMQTSKSAMPPPITLQPGIPTVLGGTDLNWYVQPQNLEFGGGYSASTYEQTRALPEGPVSITFTAYDYVRSDVQVSLPSSTFFYATLNNPPLLNYPACGMAIPQITPQFLNFSWLPQNTSSPNSALQTNYIFSLWQVLPAGYSYQDIVQSAQPLFTTTVQQPNFVYGPAQPMLVPGQQYAWRVQAVDASGRDIFGNNGYSQTCNFTYSGDSSQGIINYPAIQINAVSAGAAQGKAWWSGNNDSSLAALGYTQYELYYHKSQGNYDWDTAIVSDTLYRMFNLEPATSYECRLQGYKGGSYGPYSEVVSFTTDSVKSVSCTAPVSMLNPSSGQPLASASPGMTLTYGPWNVQLLTVQPLGGPGQFKGTCSVTVPFMAGMSFNASFSSLTIDDSRNVTAGTINFLSQGLQSWIDSSINNQMGGSMYGKVVSGTDVTNVTVPVSLANITQLPVTDSTDGSISSFTIPGTPPIVVQVDDDMQEVTIKDSTGNTYALDNQGNLTQLTLADGSVQSFFGNPRNVASLDTLATGMGVVDFVDTKGATFAFDSWKPLYAQASAILTGQYEKLTGGPGNYYVPQKAIGAGASDIVGLDIDLPDNMDEDSLVFATGKGVRLIWDPTDYNLNLLGGPAADAQEIYALYPKPGGGYYSLGKLLLSAYEEQDFTAVLVPVMGADGKVPSIDPQQYEDSLNSIYNKVNVFWTVTTDSLYADTSWDTNKDGLLTMTGSSFLSNSLKGEPATLMSNYMAARPMDKTKPYLFVLNNYGGNTGDPGGAAGDMPRGQQYGFIFLDQSGTPAQTAVAIAHELGHGQFNLEHTFSGDIGLGQGATTAYPNLMDYVPGNYRHLYKYQWNQVHQPGQVLGIFESDKAGQTVVGNIAIFAPFKNSQGYTFMTPGGEPFTLPASTQSLTLGDIADFKDAKASQIGNIPQGALQNFVIGGVTYSAYSSSDYTQFLYYANASGQKYTDTLTNKLMAAEKGLKQAIVGYPCINSDPTSNTVSVMLYGQQITLADSSWNRIGSGSYLGDGQFNNAILETEFSNFNLGSQQGQFLVAQTKVNYSQGWNSAEVQDYMSKNVSCALGMNQFVMQTANLIFRYPGAYTILSTCKSMAVPVFNPNSTVGDFWGYKYNCQQFMQALIAVINSESNVDALIQAQNDPDKLQTILSQFCGESAYSTLAVASREHILSVLTSASSPSSYQTSLLYTVSATPKSDAQQLYSFFAANGTIVQKLILNVTSGDNGIYLNAALLNLFANSSSNAPFTIVPTEDNMKVIQYDATIEVYGNSYFFDYTLDADDQHISVQELAVPRKITNPSYQLDQNGYHVYLYNPTDMVEVAFGSDFSINGQLMFRSGTIVKMPAFALYFLVEQQISADAAKRLRAALDVLVVVGGGWELGAAKTVGGVLFGTLDALTASADLYLNVAGGEQSIINISSNPAQAKEILDNYGTIVNLYYTFRMGQGAVALGKSLAGFVSTYKSGIGTLANDVDKAFAVGTPQRTVVDDLEEMAANSGAAPAQAVGSIFKHVCTSGAVITYDARMGTFLIGSFTDDLQYILEELNYPKIDNVDFTFPVPAGQKFNLLNISDQAYTYWAANGGFFTKVNGPWIDAAVAQQADIVVVSDVKMVYDPKTNQLTGFGKEVNRLEWSHGYRYNPATKMMVPPAEAGSLPTLTQQSDYIQKLN